MDGCIIGLVEGILMMLWNRRQKVDFIRYEHIA
jgi:hypothetical protein